LTRSSTLQFPNSYILNHHIIVASFEEKGSGNQKEVKLTSFFVLNPSQLSLNSHYLWLQLFYFLNLIFSEFTTLHHKD
jgi:hypothetical protein